MGNGVLLGRGPWLIISAATGVEPTNSGSCWGQAPAACFPAGAYSLLSDPPSFLALWPLLAGSLPPGIITLKPATLLGQSQA